MSCYTLPSKPHFFPGHGTNVTLTPVLLILCQAGFEAESVESVASVPLEAREVSVLLAGLCYTDIYVQVFVFPISLFLVSNFMI